MRIAAVCWKIIQFPATNCFNWWCCCSV